MIYVCGFLFSPDNQRVVLIKKKKPEWQAGLFNGVGGKVEEDEDPDDSMVREFLEETKLLVQGWKPFANLYNDDFSCHFYFAKSEGYHRVRTVEKEEVQVHYTNHLPPNIIPNLTWLIPLALDENTVKPVSAMWER